MTLRRFHRLNAIVLGLFITAHLINHAFALIGPVSHIGVMEHLRSAYRLFPVEALIMALFGSQIVVGVLLATRRGRSEGAWAWAQVISGGVIAFFLLQHIGAVLFMRLTSDLDTNFYWAAVVASADPIRWYFIPYYWLGMSAIFVHIATALHFQNMGRSALRTGIIAFGAVFAGLVVAALAGGFYHFTLPLDYITYLSEMYGL